MKDAIGREGGQCGKGGRSASGDTEGEDRGDRGEGMVRTFLVPL
jgi:hypothetical protein